MTPMDIRRKFDTLWSERKTVEGQWQAIEQFVAPFKGKFFNTDAGEHGVEWQTARNIFDATAVQAHIQLASSIHGALTNPAIKWFDFEWRDLETRKNHDAQVWIEEASKRVYDELQDSNFNLEANNVYRGLTSFATAAVTEEANAEPSEPWAGVNFTSVPIKQVYFEPDDKGQCLNFYRLLSWRPSKIVAKFGIENVPDKVKTAFESASDVAMEIIFCAYTRLDKQDQTDTVLTPENRPYGWTYIMRDDAEQLAEGGYYEMPAYIVRWELTDESMWGNGPANYALADILTLNQLVELDLRSREKVIDPAILYRERSLINTLDLGPGAQNACRDPDGIKAFESAARFDAVEATIVRLQMAVRKYFYIDQLELKESPAMTATEVQVRYEMMQRLLSSTMSRLKEDFLDPLLQRTFNLLYRAGELGQPPEGQKLGAFDVNYIGPLSRSMKFDQSASIERWVTQLQLIAQLGGEAENVLLVPDYDAIARSGAAQLNLPTEYTRPKAKVDADIEASKEQKQRTVGSEAAANEASAVRDLTQAQTLGAGNQDITA
tara:strand:- start:7755 stop:9401 length:1647 start_codon:yes stop_codon:yes gene_type:complete